ncbi:polysaccharide export protein, PEP-CTERM sytem-associated [Geobacter metallireducens RCH3]|uniref:Periplasmic polysaccharide biosynthesis/export protein n=2 Tax=Geobacter metallireducens TaxID=28232 RepID=Q39U15_GEOMG|nr:polysaccharide biosynthesis/export family protein [Geobacter metallireducens]ABB32259.1 periplasmic polysaccharide biosynthesis/export protein [Geobacter metallireducens GS-15]EHP86973.1 polysaccharide export protein, PEP-CTERM sytem-associated [Geobacter metallireducens RCH3]
MERLQRMLKFSCGFIAVVLVVTMLSGTSAMASEGSDGDYVVGDGDSLMISVWGEKELSGTVTVRPDGKITLPAIGDVIASGFTPTKLSEDLAEKLAKVVNKPIVTVTVNTVTNNKIYVFGGGVPSGVAVLPSRTTLLQFLIRYGNFKGIDLGNAYLLRNGKKMDVDFHSLLVKGDVAKDVPLKPEDMIYIPDNEAYKIYVMGAVANPKYVFYRDGLRILDAIIETGGFTKFAKENDVLIVRKEGTSTTEISAKVKDLMKEGDMTQNVHLKPGDFVIVKESIF